MTSVRLFWGVAGAVGLNSLAFGFWDEHAKEMLERCMDKTLNVNVRAIVSQRCQDSNQVLQIKVEQTRTGKSRMTIIAPIGQQGVELVDDGNVMTTFDPDTHQTEVRRSHRHREFSSSGQVSLAERNYRLSVGEKARVAGRPAMVVNAIPRHAGMASRKYYIDATTAYLLRLEVNDRHGSTVTSFDTVSVSYPEAIDEPTTRASRDDIRRVMRQQKNGDPLSYCGLPPTQLPFGFVIQEIEPIGNSGRAIRVTDGLVKGMIYEWRRKPGEAPPDESDNWSDVGDIRVLVSLEVPNEVRRGLLRAFKSEIDLDIPDLTPGRSQIFGTRVPTKRVQE